MVLGYNHPKVNEAISEQLSTGLVVSPTPHPLETEVAERIIALCPGVEAVRLGKTGSDAVAAAVRCARAFTGRQLVLADVGYHGWHDWFSCLLPFHDGIIDAQEEWNWRWNGKLGFWLHEAAALVLEPDKYSKEQLEEIIDYCAYFGTLVIFDEVICGFRMAPGGAREFYGLQPDLSCYGKAMANGMPVSAVGGSWDVMKTFDKGFWSTSHGGECLSLAAAVATLDEIGDGQILKEINARGEHMATYMRKHGAEVTCSYGARVHWDITEDQQRGLMKHGILSNGDWFGMDSHDFDHVNLTLQAIRAVV